MFLGFFAIDPEEIFIVFRQLWKEKADDPKLCSPVIDASVKTNYTLFCCRPPGPLLKDTTLGTIALVTNCCEKEEQQKATGINNESSDYMPRAKPQFSVCLAGSQLFTQLDTEQQLLAAAQWEQPAQHFAPANTLSPITLDGKALKDGRGSTGKKNEALTRKPRI